MPTVSLRRRAPFALRRAAFVFTVTAVVVALPATGTCAEAIPEGATIAEAKAPVLTLDVALKTFRERGFDLLLAEAAVRGAEGDAIAARAVANPALTLGYSRAFGYDPSACGGGSGCSADGYSAGITDQGAISNILAGKRSLRVRVADAAIAVARMARADASRMLEFQVKQQYMQVLSAAAAYDFSIEVRTFLTKQFELSKMRYPSVINEGQLARVETDKLESDQAVDTAFNTLRQAEVDLAFLMGERGSLRPFDVDRNLLRYQLPSALAAATAMGLYQEALSHRPDLRGADLDLGRARDAVDSAKRSVFPDIALGLNYSQTGTGQNAISPPTLGVTLTAPIPVFYQNRGEIRRAEADRDTRAITRTKIEAQVLNDIESAWSNYAMTRRQVERMETTLLERARKARDITQLQFNAGSATLMDFLDAQRTFVSTNVEYFGLLAAYWTAVYQLEQAVGKELRS